MATLLVVIIYLAYISLGIPDSLLGAAWPAIYQDLDLPLSSASYVSMLISSGTILSSLLSSRLVARFGTGKITAVCTAMTAAALSGFSVSPSLLCLCLCAIPLGLGAGSIDAALNNYVALHYGPTTMSFLHCFYGVGVSVSPYLMSLALSEDMNWHRGYRTMFFFQALIAVLCICALPLWKQQAKKSAEEEKTESLSLLSQLKDPAIRMSCLIFMGSCAIESMCLVWGGTFLAEAKGMSSDLAARLITFYFIGVTLGRFLSGVLAGKIKAFLIIRLGQLITLIAVVLLLLPLFPHFAVLGLFLVGLGNGPVYPNMSYLTPHVFGRSLSQAVIGTQMAASYVSILLSPVLFGQLAERVSVQLFAPFMLLMFFIMIAATAAYSKTLPEQERP